MALDPADRIGGASRPMVASGPVATPEDRRRRWEGDYWIRRRDLEQRLHDGPALRLAALTLHLGLLGKKLQAGSGNLQRDIDDLQRQLHTVLQELRAIADQIYPPLLHEAGLGPALHEAAGQARVNVHVHATDSRFDPAVEGVAYFAALDVLERLDPDAAPVEVMVRRDEDGLALDLANVDTRHGGTVLDRIQGLGGTVDIVSGPTMGTIRMRIPCE
jgi:signal transduction histidine kinase